MATTSTELADAPSDSFSRGNGVQSWTIAGASGAGGTCQVKAAVTSPASQIYFKGELQCSAATVLTFKTAAGGTAIAAYRYALGTTKKILVGRTEASELLQLHSSDNVTITGILHTLPVAAGFPVPPEWQLNT